VGRPVTSPGTRQREGLRVRDQARVRTVTLDRPERLNAFDEQLYDNVARALLDAANDDSVAVAVLTGAGRAFSAGQDLVEMSERIKPGFVPGEHGFPGLVEVLADFPKPLIAAVNGLGVGIGVTILGFADLVVMSSAARLRCPFTSLGLAAEAASSFLFPQLLGRQNAAWLLMSSEWIDAAEAKEIGLAWRVCPPDQLAATVQRYAASLAGQPVTSLRAIKSTIVGAFRQEIGAACARENALYDSLLGGPANREALAAFAEKRAPDFVGMPGAS
jgi:enoyl-CoA hydratase/carnithine racemase